MAILASAAILLIYLAVILSTVKLRMKKRETTEKTFKAPGGLIIPFIGIISIIWLLSNLDTREIFSTVIFITAVCILYFIKCKMQLKKIPSGEIH